MVKIFLNMNGFESITFIFKYLYCSKYLYPLLSVTSSTLKLFVIKCSAKLQPGNT